MWGIHGIPLAQVRSHAGHAVRSRARDAGWKSSTCWDVMRTRHWRQPCCRGWLRATSRRSKPCTGSRRRACSGSACACSATAPKPRTCCRRSTSRSGPRRCSSTRNARAHGPGWARSRATVRSIACVRCPRRCSVRRWNSAETVPDPAPSPASQADARSQRSRLDDCLGRLGQRGQALIRTAFFEGVTYDELAARTGSPLGSVKSWIRRGLLQLRECLDQ